MRNFASQLYSITLLIEKFSGLIFIPLLVISLGSYDFGIWTQLLILIPIMNLIILLNFDNFIINKFSLDSHDKFYQIAYIVFQILFFAIFISLIFILFNAISQSIFGNAFDSKLLLFFCFYLSEALFSLLLSSFRAINSSNFSVAYLVRSLFRIFAITFVVFEQLSLFQLIELIIYANFVAIVIFGALLIKDLDIRYTFIRAISGLSSFLSVAKESIIFSGVMIGFFAISNVDRFIIQFFLGLEEVAKFSIASSAASVPMIFCHSLIVVIYPLIAASKNLNTDKIKLSIIKFNEIFFIITLTSLYLLFNYSDLVYSFLGIKDQFNGYLYTSAILLSVSGAVLFNFIILLPMVANEKKLVGFSMLLIAAIKIPLLYLAIKLEPSFIGIASVISIILGSLFMILLSAHPLAEQLKSQSIIRAILILLVAMLVNFSVSKLLADPYFIFIADLFFLTLLVLLVSPVVRNHLLLR
ncbi:MAG: lipopolysaccharide biosynthesis protein [Proteobacteria bacterium]|nr:lipopolysaccharide biosynthesis protein [Pseudomonadota bacterium]